MIYLLVGNYCSQGHLRENCTYYHMYVIILCTEEWERQTEATFMYTQCSNY